MEQRIETCREGDSSVRIGVAGHRMDRLSSEDVLALQDLIGEVLGQLQRAFEGTNPNAGPATLAVVTSLAEGADRIVAREAVEHGLLETVVLPFPRDRFERDFATADSQREFHDLLNAAATIIEPPNDVSGREDGYETASSVIVECADLLIAVWNGMPGRGAGGTAHTIDRAMKRGVPVVWVGSHNPYAVQVIAPTGSLAEPHVAVALAKFQSGFHDGLHPGTWMGTDSHSTLVR